MNLRDFLTLFGGICLAVGTVLMHHVNSTTVYIIGEIMTAAAGPIMAMRAILPPPVTPAPTEKQEGQH